LALLQAAFGGEVVVMVMVLWREGDGVCGVNCGGDRNGDGNDYGVVVMMVVMH
jgi:hypothetical protein